MMAVGERALSHPLKQLNQALSCKIMAHRLIETGSIEMDRTSSGTYN